MDHAFIAALETWGSGGEFLDVLTLDDGKIIAVTATRIAVYDDAAAFEEGIPLVAIARDASEEGAPLTMIERGTTSQEETPGMAIER